MNLETQLSLWNDYLTDSEACFNFVLSVKDGVK